MRLEENITKAIWNLSYTYDAAGNPLSITDTPATGAGDAQCFAYDGLRRLTQAWTPANANCATAPSTAGLGGAAPYWFTDSFDPVGNRTQRVVHDAAGDTTHTYAYPAAGTDGAHTLTSVTASGPAGTTTNTYAYDDAGNTTTRTVAGAPAQTLTWDAEGELASLAEAGGATDSYLYTADGDRLIRRQDGATTVYLPGGQELTLSGGQVKATRYYTFGGQTIAVRTGTGGVGVTSLISDRHGTAELSVHNTTRVVTRRYTDPYGNPRGTAPTTWTGDHGYLDKPTDTTGLTQIGARYYDPAIGRFISVDPIMDLADPQQWHGYAYANNNPITWTDPTGLLARVDDEGQRGFRRARRPPPSPAGLNSQGQYTPGYEPAVGTSVRPPVVTPSSPGQSGQLGTASSALGFVGDAVDESADAAAGFADIASQAARDLRGGSSEAGALLARFRYDEAFRIMARIGRNPLVRVVSKGGGWVTIAITVPLDLAANYMETYGEGLLHG